MQRESEIITLGSKIVIKGLYKLLNLQNQRNRRAGNIRNTMYYAMLQAALACK